ncbi:MAG: hypothetical protein IT582_06730 [Opitutaceae bacterium]|nr:hypothetical protein [Opitutaceae bacterium]
MSMKLSPVILNEVKNPVRQPHAISLLDYSASPQNDKQAAISIPLPI